ncbi:MAG: HAD family hydrolase [Anaerolineae bacterium]|nr:HAD family hydrolase [Anaerolineae bacterium]
MNEQSLRIRAVLFDLDDTLLYNDMEGTFLARYFAALTEYARPLCEPAELMSALHAATQAAIASQDPHGPTNEASFAAVFALRIGRPWDEIRAFLMGFYQTRFPDLHVYARAHPDARRAVQACLDAGHIVAIATNPLFPAIAIEQRLSWAGVADMPFALVTTYENMHTTKPSPAYYAEIARRIDVPEERCLMVGNDVLRDIAPAQRAGMRTYLAEKWVTNPDPDAQPDRTGTLGELIAWIADGADPHA